MKNPVKECAGLRAENVRLRGYNEALSAEVERLQGTYLVTVNHLAYAQKVQAEEHSRAEAAEAEVTKLRTALSGRTYFHSDAAVEAKLAKYAALEKAARECFDNDKAPTNHPPCMCIYCFDVREALAALDKGE